MEIDDISVLVVGAAAAAAEGARRAGGRDASACCWALACCVNDNLDVHMRASNESRENALAACKTLEASSSSSFGLATSGHSCQTQPYNSISCRPVRFQAKRPVILICAEL